MKGHHINPENELIMRLQKDETKAFEALFHLYKKRVKGFVHKMLPPHISSDNVVMEVFIKVWLNREKIDPTKTFSSFLFVVAKNQVLDELKAAVNQKLVYSETYLLEKTALHQETNETTEEEMETVLQKMLDKLPQRRRQIFNLSRFEGLSYKQIAAKLNITENTVDTQIRKSLQFLRQEYNNIL